MTTATYTNHLTVPAARAGGNSRPNAKQGGLVGLCLGETATLVVGETFRRCEAISNGKNGPQIGLLFNFGANLGVDGEAAVGAGVAASNAKGFHGQSGAFYGVTAACDLGGSAGGTFERSPDGGTTSVTALVQGGVGCGTAAHVSETAGVNVDGAGLHIETGFYTFDLP
jgi:hypothetical protein